MSILCNCLDWDLDGVACAGLQPRNTNCRLYKRQCAAGMHAEKPSCVEVTAKQVADLARRLAISFGFCDPDMVVTSEPPAEWRAPVPMGKVYSVGDRRFQCPVWRLFEGAATEMLGAAAELVAMHERYFAGLVWC